MQRLVRRLLNIHELSEDLHLLATDSSKHRAKKDRRQQRSSFRDILRAVEVGILLHVFTLKYLNWKIDWIFKSVHVY